MSMTRSDPLVVIVGPTGIGKSALALRLAETLHGEIVSADSRQVYRGMDIGTAKPVPAERARVVHHLIDVVDPDQGFALAEFQEQAYAAIDDIACRGLLPFLVGGTGQYIHAVVEGWQLPRVPADPALRTRLYAEAEERGIQSLYHQLLALDPAAVDFVDPRNPRRVVRALEVCILSGQPFSEQRGKDPPSYTVLQIGLTMDRQTLYCRVDERIDQMIARGLVEEVRGLLDRGYGWDLPSMSSLGYLQFKAYFEASATLEETVALIKKETRRFIRHQYNWFRPADLRIHWLDATVLPHDAALALIRTFLS
jgi:tRNA dimethylallyltransferase